MRNRVAPLMWRRRRCLQIAVAAACAPLAPIGHAEPVRFRPEDDPAQSPIWKKVQASVFGGRPVQPAPAGTVLLEAPARAIDAAVVPLVLGAKGLPGGEALARLVLVIDANPSPLSGLFQFAPGSTAAEVQTRVRVDGYSHVRLIAETVGGTLYGVTRFVRASGGCSAPPGADMAAALASMGRMGVRGAAAQGAQAGWLQLSISHPNHSGLAMDQFTRQFTPAHYVRKVEVSLGERAVFSADVDFSMSENPSFRFLLPPGASEGELRVRVIDSQERVFLHRQALAAAFSAA